MIREEQVQDYPEIEKVVERVFVNVVYRDKNEHHLVSRLRLSNEYIPQLTFQ